MNKKILYNKNLRKCESCGETIPLESKFCTNCGEKQKAVKIKEEKIDENALKTSTKKEDELAENEEIIDTCKPHKAKEDLQGLD